MTEYVYVGRRRHPVKVLVYQLLTVGIYGRVLLYKMLRDFDGHEALFLDRRPYIVLLILPFIGPFLVKRRVAILLEDLAHHDVTAKLPSRRTLLLAALIPIAPWYHWLVQKGLNHHWKMHTKEEELAIKQTQLAALERKSRTKDNVAAADSLRKEVAQRQKELEDIKGAAIALREAEQVRREAEREMKRSGLATRRLGAVGIVRKILPAAAFRRRGAEAAMADEPAKEDSSPAEPPAEPAPTRKAKKEAPQPVEPKADAPPEEKPPGPSKLGGLFGFLKRGASSESRADRKAAKKEAKEKRRAAKEAAKEAKQAAKQKAKEDKTVAQEKKAAAKADAKEERGRAKAKADAAEAKKAARGGKKPSAEPKKGGKKAR